MEKLIEENNFNELEQKKIDFLEWVFESNKDKVWTEAEIKVFPAYEIKNWLLEKKETYKNIKRKNRKWKSNLKNKSKKIKELNSNLEETLRLEKKIKKDWEIIFDWTIEDIRYDDKFTKSQWYYLIRVRHLNWKERNENWKFTDVDKYQLTVKKEWKSNADAQEYEETFNSKEEIEKSLEWNWFIARKRYKKSRKEYKVNFSEKDNKKSELNLNNKYLKISFDKYQDYTEEEIIKLKEENRNIQLKNYWNIPNFVEIESPDWKKYSLEWIKKYGLEKLFSTTWWPEKILDFKNLEKHIINDNVVKYRNLSNAILANSLSNNKELYKWLTDEDREKYKNTFTYIKWLSKLFTVSIEDSLKLLLEEEPKYSNIFWNLIFEKPFLQNYINNYSINKDQKYKFTSNKDIEYQTTNKFSTKINNYLNWYEVAILNSIQKELEKKDEVDDHIIHNALKNKLKSFIKLLFIFWNNLNKEQLEEMLNKDEESIEKEFIYLKSDIEKLFNCKDTENIKSFSLPKTIRHLASEVYFENQKIEKQNKKNNENKEIITLKNKSEEHILDSFTMLSKDFSTWLNSPKNKNSSEDEFINNLKNTWKDLFKTISILKENSIAFTNLTLKPEIITQIIKDNNFKDAIFNDKNFSLWDVEEWIKKEKELLKIFLLWLNNDEDTIWKIRDEFLDFNENRIINILDKEVKYWDEEINIKDLKNIIEWNNDEKFDVNKISYSLWKSIPYNIKFDIYVKYILKNKNKFNEIYSDITKYNNDENNNDEISNKINSFIKIEYRKNIILKNEKL